MFSWQSRTCKHRNDISLDFKWSQVPIINCENASAFNCSLTSCSNHPPWLGKELGAGGGGWRETFFCEKPVPFSVMVSRLDSHDTRPFKNLKDALESHWERPFLYTSAHTPCTNTHWKVWAADAVCSIEVSFFQQNFCLGTLLQQSHLTAH